MNVLKFRDYVKTSSAAVLPAEVSEGTVGLSHLVHIITLAHGSTLVGSGFLDFVSQSLSHGDTLAVAGVVDDPAHSQSFGTVGSYFQRNLVSSTTHAAALHLHTVKGFGIVNNAEIDVFLELSCFSMIQQMLAI